MMEIKAVIIPIIIDEYARFENLSKSVPTMQFVQSTVSHTEILASLITIKQLLLKYTKDYIFAIYI